MIYKFGNYTINTLLSTYEQNTHFIQIASCLSAFPLVWNVASAREWDFTSQQFWCSWVFAHLRGNIADNAMQFRVTVTITKNASLAAIARYISITTIYTVGYLQITKQGISFQVSIAMICKERSIGLSWFSTKPQIMTLFT